MHDTPIELSVGTFARSNLLPHHNTQSNQIYSISLLLFVVLLPSKLKLTDR